MLLIYGGDWFGNGSVPSIYLTLLFIGESALLMALSGGSFGQLATRLRVVRIDGSGRPLSLLPALLRQVMICLVIPPLVFRPDGRGLHDLVGRLGHRAAAAPPAPLLDLPSGSGYGASRLPTVRSPGGRPRSWGAGPDHVEPRRTPCAP